MVTCTMLRRSRRRNALCPRQAGNVKLRGCRAWHLELAGDYLCYFLDLVGETPPLGSHSIAVGARVMCGFQRLQGVFGLFL
jgi:hypothetical protein